MSYYDRSSTTHLDGTPIFQTQEDRSNEQDIAKTLEVKWNCQLHPFGALAPVDWYAVRHGRIVGVLELKSRTHVADKYPTVFLNVRKWLSLSLASVGLGCPAIFVVKFTDCVRWLTLSEADPSSNRIAGCNRIVKSVNDIEPVIEVPVSNMRAL